MKIKTAVSMMTVMSVLSFGAFAADSLTQEQANGLHSFGTVSVTGNAGAPSDIHQALNQAAEAKGATSYHVTEARENDTWHATAELYK